MSSGAAAEGRERGLRRHYCPDQNKAHVAYLTKYLGVG